MSDLQTYDVADFLKKWYRELPEPLVPGKISEQLAAVIDHIPKHALSPTTPTRRQRTASMKRSRRSQLCLPAPSELELTLKCALVLLTDENRYTLRALLGLLSDTAQQSKENQMTEQNLAVCWAPSLFSSTVCGHAVATAPTTSMMSKHAMNSSGLEKSHQSLLLGLVSPSLKESKSFQSLQMQHSSSSTGSRESKSGRHIQHQMSMGALNHTSLSVTNSLSTLQTTRTNDTVARLVDCLSFMINNHERLFKISKDLCDVGFEVLGNK